MSALAMILTAVMMVVGDGPEKVSGEIILRPEPLDLRGDWKGKLTTGGKTFEGKMKGLVFVLTPKETPFLDLRDCITDEGNGKFSVGYDAKNPIFLGIYMHEGDKLSICLRLPKFGRPTQFTSGDFCNLLILHRVKSRK